MANSENTFGDRLTPSPRDANIILKFDRPFDPANTALQAANFSSFLDLLEARNTLVANAGPASTASISLPVTMATIKSRTTRVVDYVSSNEAWTQFSRSETGGRTKCQLSPGREQEKRRRPPARPRSRKEDRTAKLRRHRSLV